jgi:hypothetical protein
MKSISKLQRLQLELIREANCNAFIGGLVEADLLCHEDLWVSCMMTRTGPMCLITLRDLPDEWSVNELFIVAEPGKRDELLALAKTWDANKVGWLTEYLVDSPVPSSGEFGSMIMGGSDVSNVLRVWWDSE